MSMYPFYLCFCVQVEKQVVGEYKTELDYNNTVIQAMDGFVVPLWSNNG